jgi:hypothetical protein
VPPRRVISIDVGSPEELSRPSPKPKRVISASKIGWKSYLGSKNDPDDLSQRFRTPKSLISVNVWTDLAYLGRVSSPDSSKFCRLGLGREHRVIVEIWGGRSRVLA